MYSIHIDCKEDLPAHTLAQLAVAIQNIADKSALHDQVSFSVSVWYQVGTDEDFRSKP